MSSLGDHAPDGSAGDVGRGLSCAALPNPTREDDGGECLLPVAPPDNMEYRWLEPKVAGGATAGGGFGVGGRPTRDSLVRWALELASEEHPGVPKFIQHGAKGAGGLRGINGGSGAGGGRRGRCASSASISSWTVGRRSAGRCRRYCSPGGVCATGAVNVRSGVHSFSPVSGSTKLLPCSRS